MNRSSSKYRPTASNATIDGAVLRFAFAGKEKDLETGLSYFGARYYDADLTTGWLSVDPMADKYPSMSPYSYCADNPVKLVDPDGMDVWAINDNGELIWKKASDQDRIIARDGSFVDVVEGVLKRGVNGERGKDYNLSNQHYGLSFQNNEDNAYEVFEFFADHSNVEFSLYETEGSAIHAFYITTSFEQDGDSWGCEMSNRANLDGTLKSHTHSHPNGSMAQSFEKDVFSFIGNKNVDAYVYCPKGRNLSPQYRNGGYKRYHSSHNQNSQPFFKSKMIINGNEKIYKISH